MGLAEYIQQLRQYGYTPEQIEQYLLTQGYDINTIRQAFSQTGVARPKPIVKYLLITFFAVSLGLGAFVLFFPRDTAPIVEVEVVNVSMPGKPVELSVTVESPAEQSIRIVMEIISDETGSKVASSRDSFGKVKKATKGFSVIIPSKSKPGDYKVKVSATGGEKTGLGYARFTIEEVLVETTEPVVQKDTIVAPTNITVPAKVPVETPTDSIPENITEDKKLLPMTVDDIAELSSTNLGKAIELCSSHDLPDSCFNKVANAVKQSELCERIKSSSTRDSCYSSFAINYDYSVCPKISSDALRKACESMKSWSAENKVQT